MNISHFFTHKKMFFPLKYLFMALFQTGTGPWNTKLSTLDILLASTDSMESGTTPGKPLEPECE